MPTDRITKIEAVRSLFGRDSYNKCRGDGVVDWKDGHTTTEEETAQIDTEFARLQTEYDAQDYARQRKAAYPSTADFMEAYTEKEIGGDSTKWDAYIINYNKVRTENPK
tara:strand:- start:5 stop:331 length:327 start_codon:yes stop_codon:yes gene_type:complete